MKGPLEAIEHDGTFLEKREFSFLVFGLYCLKLNVGSFCTREIDKKKSTIDLFTSSRSFIYTETFYILEWRANIL